MLLYDMVRKRRLFLLEYLTIINIVMGGRLVILRRLLIG